MIMIEKKLIVHENGNPIYPIILTNSFDGLELALRDFHLEDRRVCIVSETRVAVHYEPILRDKFEKLAKETHSFVFEAGEQSKNLSTVNKLYEFLIVHKFDRKDLLIALGGGVVGDLTGFAAATYLRGIEFIQVPTSLLSQVDSSIGGKTGVDYLAYKNMVGAFHQPKLVYINIKTLNTLSKREYYSGLGEIIKHGLIKDESYYRWLLTKKEEIKALDEQTLIDMIYRSCDIKRGVVERDPKEHGERALLNFGHTIGHAVEKLMNFSYLHGECVGLGILVACNISLQRKNMTKEQYDELKEWLDYFEFPAFPREFSAKEIIDTTKLDKKMEHGIIKFILLNKIGEACIKKDVTEEEMENAILMQQKEI